MAENINVIDNLNSTSETDALSANMGRVLNENNEALKNRVSTNESETVKQDDIKDESDVRLVHAESGTNSNTIDIQELLQKLQDIIDGNIKKPFDVIDNLLSTSVKDALSANQGRELNERIITLTNLINDLTGQNLLNSDNLIINLNRIITLENAPEQEIIEVIDNLISMDTNKALSANQGRELKAIFDQLEIDTNNNSTSLNNHDSRLTVLENEPIPSDTVIDNLESIRTDAILSANQGFILNAYSESIESKIAENQANIANLEVSPVPIEGIPPAAVIITGKNFNDPDYINNDNDVLIDAASNPINASIYGEKVDFNFDVNVPQMQPNAFLMDRMVVLSDEFSMIPFGGTAGSDVMILSNTTGQYIAPGWSNMFNMDNIVGIIDGNILYNNASNLITLIKFDTSETDINLFIDSFEQGQTVNLSLINGLPIGASFNFILSSSNNDYITFCGLNNYFIVTIDIQSVINDSFIHENFTYYDLNNIDGLLYGNSYTANLTQNNQNFILNKKNNLVCYGFGSNKTAIQEIDFINKQVVNTIILTESMAASKTFACYAENKYIIQNFTATTDMTKIYDIDNNFELVLETDYFSFIFFYSKKNNSPFYLYRKARTSNPTEPIQYVFIDGQELPITDYTSELIRTVSSLYLNSYSYFNQWKFNSQNFIYMAGYTTRYNPAKLLLDAVSTGLVLVKGVNKISDDKSAYLKLG